MITEMRTIQLLLDQSQEEMDGPDWLEKCLILDKDVYDDALLERNITKLRWTVYLRSILIIYDEECVR